MMENERQTVILAAKQEWSDADNRAFIGKISPTTTLARLVDASLRGARMEPLSDAECTGLEL